MTNTATQGDVETKSGYHHGNLERALLDAGLHTLTADGLKALTLRRCASLAGVSQTAIRNHFSDKSELLAALAAEGFKQLARRREEQALPGGSVEERLFGLIDNYVTFARDNPDLFRLMFATRELRINAYPRLRGVAYRSYEQFVAMVRDCFSGSHKEWNGSGPAFMVWSAMHGFAMLVIDEQYRPERDADIDIDIDIDIAERCRQMAQMLQQGLAVKELPDS